MAVVGEHDARRRETEWMQICLCDHFLLAICDPPYVRDQAGRCNLGSEISQVSIERRHPGDPVDEWLLGPKRVRVPGGHAETGQVEERGHHARAVGLAHE